MRPTIHPREVPGIDWVVVKEMYVSLQGESSHQGLVCAFIRLTGCHLRCSYCDSAFAFYGGQRLRLAAVLEKVQSFQTKLVEVTGGEPLLQPGVYPLMRLLLREGYRVLLETSGAIDVRLVPREVHKIVDMKTPSSGECARNTFSVFDSMTERDEVKFVIGSREDYQWAKRILRQHGLLTRPFGRLFSTAFGVLEARTLAEWIVEDGLPVRFQLQQHKYLWQPNARGV